MGISRNGKRCGPFPFFHLHQIQARLATSHCCLKRPAQGAEQRPPNPAHAGGDPQRRQPWPGPANECPRLASGRPARSPVATSQRPVPREDRNPLGQLHPRMCQRYPQAGPRGRAGHGRPRRQRPGPCRIRGASNGGPPRWTGGGARNRCSSLLRRRPKFCLCEKLSLSRLVVERVVVLVTFMYM